MSRKILTSSNIKAEKAFSSSEGGPNSNLSMGIMGHLSGRRSKLIPLLLPVTEPHQTYFFSLPPQCPAMGRCIKILPETLWDLPAGSFTSLCRKKEAHTTHPPAAGCGWSSKAPLLFAGQLLPHLASMSHAWPYSNAGQKAYNWTKPRAHLKGGA